ncbi:MAG: sodium:solute symporter [Chitinophagaceae bacterium]|nr:sodium:solute symporter [Chitinophagaceae bacterium]MBK9463906.1 sodium:solute symporter [Chitinophagaceae bacterium]MBK9937499.1 sodium:solute symporter [Chitinophagaceae bacterium]
MSPVVLFSFVIGYFVLLLAVAWFTSRNSNNESFFIGNRNSNWMLVAFGMIGTSLSGVTFVSVPGGVASGNFYYFQIVLGYLLGYMVIAFVLLPLYYKMNLTSIYTYLEKRFGINAHKAGAFFFILSRTVGATARLYLVISVLQIFIFNKLNIPFEATALVILLLILLYTFEGGVKTIIYTDTLQTTGMLVGLVVCIIVIVKALGTDFGGAWTMMADKGYTQIFNWDVNDGRFALKHIIGGMFIAIAMTGLDQEMMQKNISVKNLKDSQKNMMTFTAVLMVVNFLFLVLGGVLYLYASSKGITAAPDDLFPTIALSDTFSGVIGIIFVIAIISALFPSVDGAITSLTSCFCIDILGINKKEGTEKEKKSTRLKVHFTFALIFFLMVLLFKAINDKLIIDFILKFAGITYGPLLGLFAFGILTKRKLNEKLIWAVCIIAPLLALGIDMLSNPLWYNAKLHTDLGLQSISESIFNGYKIGNELILINGILTFLGLWFISTGKKGNDIQLQAV